MNGFLWAKGHLLHLSVTHSLSDKSVKKFLACVIWGNPHSPSCRAPRLCLCKRCAETCYVIHPIWINWPTLPCCVYRGCSSWSSQCGLITAQLHAPLPKGRGGKPSEGNTALPYDARTVPKNISLTVKFDAGSCLCRECEERGGWISG